MEKEIFLTDLDDVICKGGYLKLLNMFLNTSYVESDFFNQYYLEEIAESEDVKTEIRRYWIEKNVYDYSHLIDGAYDSLKMISEELEIYVCSSTHFPGVEPKLLSKIYAQKFNYITENLPFIKPENIIFSCNKSIFNDRVLIQLDDKVNNLNSDALIKLLFYAGHNKDFFSKESITSDDEYRNLLRCKNWEDVCYFVQNRDIYEI